MKRVCSIVLALCVVASVRSSSHGTPQPKTLGGIQLQPGFQHMLLGGMDMRRGRIWKANGPEIVYEIGPLADNPALRHHKAGETAWLRTVRLAKQPFAIALAKDDETVWAAFPEHLASFTATHVRSKEDMADLILMLATFDGVAAFQGK